MKLDFFIFTEDVFEKATHSKNDRWPFLRSREGLVWDNILSSKPC